MKFETQKEYPLIPSGEHVLKLTGCDVQEFEDRYGKSDTGTVERIKWRFMSQEEDESGVPYDFVVYTGKAYGNDKAGLTRLIDMLVPGMTEKKFADFDSDDLIGKKFRAQIKHVKKDDGKIKPDYVYMAPMGSKKPAAQTDTEELSDPFADEAEYQKAA